MTNRRRRSALGWFYQGRKFGRDADYEESEERLKQKTIEIIDDHGFNKRLFSVGSSGFLASSYGLFATNVIKPALYYVYPPCGALGPNAGTVIDQLTLVGTALGMFFAGYFADLWGRKRLYGFELAILVIATLGVVQSSEGFRVAINSDGSTDSTMNIYSWIAWWRFVLGIGIGAEYPLSAVITAEWAATKSRGRMLAGVFAMQAVARLLAFGVGLATLRGISSQYGILPDALDDQGLKMKRVVDQFWRVVTGAAVVPAAIAMVLRLCIPETPRYHADIRNDVGGALQDTKWLFGQSPQPAGEKSQVIANGNQHRPREAGNDEEGEETREAPRRSHDEFSMNDSETNGTDEASGSWWKGAWHYLKWTNAWKHLIVISLLWAIMDVGWYGLSMDSPGALSTLWHDPSVSAATSTAPLTTNERRADGTFCAEYNSWRSDPNNTSMSIYRVLEANSIRSMLVVSIGSLLGNIALVIVVNRFHRRNILTTTFIILGFLFAITGGTLIGTTKAHQSHMVSNVFFGIMHFFFTVGPKTLILVMAIEMFPTAYRATFYGIAAATGKVGAIIIRAVIGATGNGELYLGWRLVTVCFIMFGGAWLSSLLPQVQRLPETTDIEAPTPAFLRTERRNQGVRLEKDAVEPEKHGQEHTGSDGEAPRNGWLRAALRWLRQGTRRLETMSLEEISPSPDSVDENGEEGLGRTVRRWLHAITCLFRGNGPSGSRRRE